MHAMFAPDGTPRELGLAWPKTGQRDVALALLERRRRHRAETLLGDRRYAARELAAQANNATLRSSHRAAQTSPAKGPHLAPIRQRIESILSDLQRPAHQPTPRRPQGAS